VPSKMSANFTPIISETRWLELAAKFGGRGK
jgi:hypothetical protein